MKIIILGCGKVGYTLAEQLREEDHEITVIDCDPEKLQLVQSRLDVMGFLGNGTSYRVQREAGVERADLLIAVMGKDELNLLSCLIAKKAGDCQTIARVRNPEYYEEISYIKEELGLSLAINPELVTAKDAFHLVQIPSATEIATFSKGKVNMVRFSIPEGSAWHNLRLSEAAGQLGGKFLISIIEREHTAFVPNGNAKLMEGDCISVIIETRFLDELFTKVGIQSRKIRKVLIAGGGMIAYYLAQQLIEARVKVKIIEYSKERCEELSVLLPEAMIIHGDALNETLLLEEGLEHVDAFVSLTNLDEENIMLALYANKVSNAKLITKINKITFGGIVNDIPIGSILSPRYLTAERIIHFVRSRHNSKGGAVEALYRMADNQVEALEFQVKEGSKVTEIPLMELKLKPNLLIAAIIRKNRVKIPSGQDKIKNWDTVIVVTTERGLDDLHDILE